VYIPQQVNSIPNKIIKITLGRTMGSVIDSKSLVWVFGENTQGELGLGDMTARLSPYPIVQL
jgi:alpha-tubulin suppressor-like RCC1 family protein